MPGSRVRDLARRAIGALTVATLLGAAVAVGSGLTRPELTAPPAAGTPAGGQSSAPGDGPAPAGPTAAARTIAPSPTPPPSPTPSPSGGGPASRPGSTLTARPHVDGSFLVTEVVTLPAAATEAVLRPPSTGDAGGGFRRQRPAAVDVEVWAGGQLLTVPEGPVRGEVTIRWAAPTSELRLSYRLTGVSVASTPARAGRSLATFGPLLRPGPADFPVRVVVRGRTVLSLTCPELPFARSACGAGAAPKFWTSRPLPLDQSRVLVQYDRPKRR